MRAAHARLPGREQDGAVRRGRGREHAQRGAVDHHLREPCAVAREEPPVVHHEDAVAAAR